MRASQTSTTANTLAANGIARVDRFETLLEIAPLLLVPAVALAVIPLVGSFPAWVTLTVAGLAMGMMIFMMAAGLTLGHLLECSGQGSGGNFGSSGEWAKVPDYAHLGYPIAEVSEDGSALFTKSPGTGGRGPTRLMCPARTLNSCGISSRLSRRAPSSASASG